MCLANTGTAPDQDLTSGSTIRYKHKLTREHRYTMDHTPKNETALESAAIGEVEALHRFFTAWFAGKLDPGPASFARLPNSLDRGFEIIYPSAERQHRDQLVSALEELHGAHANAQPPFAIRIENAQARALGARLVLVTYEEHQIRDGEATCRISTALLREDSDAPGGFRWLHVHETWKDG